MKKEDGEISEEKDARLGTLLAALNSLAKNRLSDKHGQSKKIEASEIINSAIKELDPSELSDHCLDLYGEFELIIDDILISDYEDFGEDYEILLESFFTGNKSIEIFRSNLLKLALSPYVRHCSGYDNEATTSELLESFIFDMIMIYRKKRAIRSIFTRAKDQAIKEKIDLACCAVDECPKCKKISLIDTAGILWDGPTEFCENEACNYER